MREASGSCPGSARRPSSLHPSPGGALPLRADGGRSPATRSTHARGVHEQSSLAERGCDLGDEAVQVAAERVERAEQRGDEEHAHARCAELAAVCRAGRLPDGECCYFWVEWSQEVFAGAEGLFPAGMWAVWQGLRPRARELLALGEHK